MWGIRNFYNGTGNSLWYIVNNDSMFRLKFVQKYHLNFFILIIVCEDSNMQSTWNHVVYNTSIFHVLQSWLCGMIYYNLNQSQLLGGLKLRLSRFELSTPDPAYTLSLLSDACTCQTWHTLAFTLNVPIWCM